MVFITAGMGGGTGTGAAPVVAQAAREMGILTVGIVSKPFRFERRCAVAAEGIANLTEHVDSLIIVPNDKLLKVLGKDFVLSKAFDYANEVLYGAVMGISELVTKPGIINVDFEDLRTVMSERGMALMGMGTAKGEDRTIKATQKAVANPLLEDISVAGARGILVNITHGENFTLGEMDEVGSMIEQMASVDGSRVIIGTSKDDALEDEVRVTVVATGLEEVEQASSKPQRTQLNVPKTQSGNPEIKQSEEAKDEAVQSQAVSPQPTVSTAQTATLPMEKPEKVKVAVNGGTAMNPNSREYLDIPAFLRRQAD